MMRSAANAVRFVHGLMSRPTFGLLSGVHSIWNPKWMLVALLYAFGTALMAMDSWFGRDQFAWNQGAFVIIISYIVVTAVAFEWKFLGRSRGINLLLQFGLILPVAVFLGRVLGRPSQPARPDTLIGRAIDLVKSGFSTVGLTELIPTWIQEIFTSAGLAVFLVLICIALSVSGRKKKISLLALALVLPTVFAVAYPPAPAPVFWLGMVLMGAGIAVQFLDVNRYIGDEAILRRLANVSDEMERRCSIRIARKGLEDGAVTETAARQIVRRCYTTDAGEPSAEEVATYVSVISYRLVHEHGILDVAGSDRGLFLVPSRHLTHEESLWEELSVWPRCLVLGAVAILWVLSPIDLIPDAIPVVGVLDDAVILLAGSAPIVQALSRARRRGAELPGG